VQFGGALYADDASEASLVRLTIQNSTSFIGAAVAGQLAVFDFRDCVISEAVALLVRGLWLYGGVSVPAADRES
jgi:hypothetical protein